MKTRARVRRATSKTPGSVVKARVFLPSLRSTQFVIYVVDKGICVGFAWGTVFIVWVRLGRESQFCSRVGNGGG